MTDEEMEIGPEVRPALRDLDELLARVSRDPDDVAAQARVRARVAQVSSAPLGPDRRRIARVVAVLVPLAAAAAVLAVVLGPHPRPTVPPLAATSPRTVVSPYGTTTAAPHPPPPALTSISMVSTTVGWASVTEPGGLRYSLTPAHTDDGGRSWRILDTPVVGPDVTFATFGPNEVWVVAGAPRPMATDPTPAASTPRSIPTTVYHSVNAGATWDGPVTFVPLGYVKAVGFRDPQRGWITTDRSSNPAAEVVLYTTADGGLHWTSRGTVAAPATNACATAGSRPTGEIAISPAGAYFAATDCGVSQPVMLLTRDGGATWRAVNLPAIAGFTPGSNGIGICVSDAPTFLPAGFAYTHGACGFSTGGNPLQYQALYVSTDGGTTWTGRQQPDAGSPRMFDAAHGFYAGLGQDYSVTINRTTDGGRTWGPITGPVPGASQEQVEFIDTLHGWVLDRAQDSPQLYSTADGGRTWVDLKATIS